MLFNIVMDAMQHVLIVEEVEEGMSTAVLHLADVIANRVWQSLHVIAKPERMWQSLELSSRAKRGDLIK